MKPTLDRIRHYRDALRVTVNLPCDCDRSGCGLECAVGRAQMVAAIGELSWVLGEAPEHEKFVGHCIREAAAIGRRN